MHLIGGSGFNIGKVDAVHDIAVLQIVGDLAHRHAGAVFLGLRGGSAEVRGGQHLRVPDNPCGREIGNKCLEIAAVQGFDDGILVDDCLA